MLKKPPDFGGLTHKIRKIVFSYFRCPVFAFLVSRLTRREFWLHINSMVEKGVTVMVTTHFMDEAEYCDRIGLVYRGKLIASGTPDDLKAQAADEQQADPTMEQAFITLINDWDKEHTHE